jgi:tRNA G18 (ribose-2'-O)-methylase SpoU
MRNLVLIAHNLRSTHNVGSLLRTADGLGVEKVYLTGYTPYPTQVIDDRLPHMAQKIDKQIKKTALGAENSIISEHVELIETVILELKDKGYWILALEQSPESTSLYEFIPPNKVALIVGREVEGIENEVLKLCNQTVEIPMQGKKESFNVVQAAAMAMYHARLVP